ncbi:MAG: hypothetical protein U1E76_16760 [Planctomycetota bacterium]
MGTMIKGVALALAGLGLLAGTGGKDQARALHEQMRTRVLERVGGSEAARDDLRTALREDPDFDRLLAYHMHRLRHTRRTPDLAEDAAQATFYKVWKGRPEIFLREHDEIERYLSVAMRRNLASELWHAAAQPGKLADGDLDGVADPTRADPAAATAASEALDQLCSRCAPEERRVLREQLSGAHSPRALAQRTGMTRFAAGRCSERIAQKLELLLS